LLILVEMLERLPDDGDAARSDIRIGRGQQRPVRISPTVIRA
jgi:hypothetical protein